MKRLVPILLAIVLIFPLCGCLSKADREKYIAAVDAEIQKNIEQYKSGEKHFSDYIDIDDVSYEIVDLQEDKSGLYDFVVTLRFEATTDGGLNETQKSLVCYDMEDLFPTKLETDNRTISAYGMGKHDKIVIEHVSSWVNGEEVHAMDGASVSSSQKSDSKDSYGHDKFDAMVAAESVVKNNLKAPSTAKFCKTSEATISLSGDTWTIKGWVDAQNSFGATLRNNFTVKITFTSSNKYTIDSCNIN